MELRHLRVFLAVASELHFGRAARRLRVAQSAVSQTIRALEDEVGAALFVRSQRMVRLAPAGELFRPYAERTLDEAAAGVAAAQSAGDGEVGRVRIQITTMASLTQVPAALAAHRRENPRVVLEVITSGSERQLEDLRLGRCDLAFVARASARANAESELLSFSPIAESALVVVVPKRHPLARRRWLTLAELAAEPMVVFAEQREPMVRMMFFRRCQSAGFTPKVAIEVDDLEALLAFVRADFGIACVPGLVERAMVRDVTIVPLRPAMAVGIHAGWNERTLSPVARKFLDRVRRA